MWFIATTWQSIFRKHWELHSLLPIFFHIEHRLSKAQEGQFEVVLSQKIFAVKTFVFVPAEFNQSWDSINTWSGSFFSWSQDQTLKTNVTHETNAHVDKQWKRTDALHQQHSSKPLSSHPKQYTPKTPFRNDYIWIRCSYKTINKRCKTIQTHWKQRRLDRSEKRPVYGIFREKSFYSHLVQSH